MTRYRWPDFHLAYNPETGEATTHYADGTRSGCAPTPDDDYHAKWMGITAKEHRLQHELAHHLVAAHWPGNPHPGCPIIWRDAHGEPQPQPESADLEWMITALQYHSVGRLYESDGVGALLDLTNMGIDPYAYGRLLAWLLDAARLGVEDLKVPVRGG